MWSNLVLGQVATSKSQFSTVINLNTTSVRVQHPRVWVETCQRCRQGWAPDCCTAFGTALTLAAWARVNPRTHPTSLVWPTLPTSPSSDSLCLSPAHTHTGTPSHTHVHVCTCKHAFTNGHSLSHTCTCTTHASTYDCLPMYMYLHVHAHKRHFLSEAYMYMYMHTHTCTFTPMGILCPTHTCVHVLVHANTCIHTYPHTGIICPIHTCTPSQS